MNFFKHFTDAHKGQSMQTLFEELGHTGPCCWWILVELCAEKIELNQVKRLEVLDCVFDFHERFLRQNLRVSRGKLEKFLRISENLSLISFTKSENVFKISMPKLLDCLVSPRQIKSPNTPAAGHPNISRNIAKSSLPT